MRRPRRGGHTLRVLRLTWGVSLLAAPGVVLRCCATGPQRRHMTWLARLLGSREIAQAALLEGRSHRRAGAGIEGVHAASMLWAAGRWPESRRCALACAGISTLLAAVELAR